MDVVVQWKAPEAVSTFVQRAGRAARNPSKTGLAVLLVEKSAYNPNVSNRGQKSTQTKKEIQKYAIAHGVNRGNRTKALDYLADRTIELEIERDDPKEGLSALIQTTVCRRNVLKDVYGNLNGTHSLTLGSEQCNSKPVAQQRQSMQIAAAICATPHCLTVLDQVLQR